ncbi:MAG: hypothetical protein WCA22_17305, partial [Candidatus Binatus sp.]
MTGRRKSILAAAIVGGAIALAAGCTTETTYETAPPYASISDEARDPSSMPTPVPSPSSSGNSGGVLSAIGTAIIYPFHLIG